MSWSSREYNILLRKMKDVLPTIKKKKKKISVLHNRNVLLNCPFFTTQEAKPNSDEKNNIYIKGGKKTRKLFKR